MSKSQWKAIAEARGRVLEHYERVLAENGLLPIDLWAVIQGVDGARCTCGKLELGDLKALEEEA